MQGRQPAQTAWFRLAIAAIECPAPESATFVQSAPLVVAHVLVFAQTYWPPATQVFSSARSAPNGAVNRGFGSSGAIEMIALSDAGCHPRRHSSWPSGG